ncbi:sigma-70 family RNA polymerase sigma factor [Adhaeribacter rhizoryzae]|uniref:Sigma-70 family RNA polymerase sigma factor n=2 Tax=Adhaeribacter rhizoryzae TaxID=2607907 RepID=A0A5M6DBY0_9BACT|nr:sigma-70 family RNA polymerase sigma factor [Adhaeribacter rhizoryzae]
MTILYDKYSAALYGIILRIVKSEVVAEDVMQETFVKIWSSIGQYNKEKGRLFTWIINIARHAAIDKIRSKEFRVGSKERSIDVSPVNQLHSGYEVRPDDIGIKDLVGKLNPDQRKIIDMMYFDGYTQSEVAEELAIPLGTVKTRTRAAMKFLIKLLS